MLKKADIYKPEEDGIDHINIYSRGKTELGRELSAFSECAIHKEYGQFNSIEGLYHYLKIMRSLNVPTRRVENVPLNYCWIKRTLEDLKSAYGVRAKSLGKSARESIISYGIECLDRPDEEFTNEIVEATEQKIRNSKELRKAVADNTLPYLHYYVKDDGKAIYMAHFGWTADVVAEAIDNVLDEDRY